MQIAQKKYLWQFEKSQRMQLWQDMDGEVSAALEELPKWGSIPHNGARETAFEASFL